MILPLAGALIGAILGAWQARKRGGARLDLLQWAAVCGIIGALAGLVILIVLARRAVAA